MWWISLDLTLSLSSFHSIFLSKAESSAACELRVQKLLCRAETKVFSSSFSPVFFQAITIWTVVYYIAVVVVRAIHKLFLFHIRPPSFTILKVTFPQLTNHFIILILWDKPNLAIIFNFELYFLCSMHSCACWKAGKFK